ncbi:FAD/NAD(P)-binding domain-containing protein [Nadsonia fulvescens var. elongata DSM 6958]|uniref:FAD/NAD(P)-binding domain-containing protein n=1 Tax=Nadsonia fulvescens var. elongata DSM 6958 TaxID=857566 RepID=A0A1E3PIY5_9ASCO|nr:FAD/NAD(P)-binding domain-containing protein [Nadsonia fulvescens var. elongata DSM 6958]
MTALDSQPKSVAIIGGGASGAIALKSLKSFNQNLFSNVILFERQFKLGGIWVYHENPGELKVEPGEDGSKFVSKRKIPSELFEERNSGKFIKVVSATDFYDKTQSTPTYERMTTNVPEPVMTFSDALKWPKDEHENEDIDTTYVGHRKVQRYLEQYMEPYENFIKYSTSVEQITKNDITDKWRLVTVTVQSNRNTGKSNPSLNREEWRLYEFDAIIVANGHYNVPSIPQVDGIDAVYQIAPERITHSKYYREPHVYRDKKVIVVGSRASGSDIIKEISSEANRVYFSRRTPGGRSEYIPNSLNQVNVKGLIRKYEITDNSNHKAPRFKVVFDDGSVVSDPDEVIYATGYKFTYPFLKRYDPSLTTGNRNPTLYQHMFHRDDPTLVFIGVPIDGISFRVFEYQAVLAARVLAGLVKLPSLHKQQEWLDSREKQYGDTRDYHTLGLDEAENYMQTLVNLGGGICSPSGAGGEGRKFPVFGEYERATVSAAKEKLKTFWDNK